MIGVAIIAGPLFFSFSVSDFLKKRFKFEVNPLFCEAAVEHMFFEHEHMLFLCPVSKVFWPGLHNWLPQKIDVILTFELSHIIFYMDTIDLSFSDLIKMIILMGKYHINCSKWK